MKTGNAAAFPVLSGSGPAVLQHGFRDLGVFGSAGVRGAARPPDGVKGGGAGGPRAPGGVTGPPPPPPAGGILVLLWKVPCVTGPLAAGGILSVLKGWGVKGGALIHGLYQSEGLVPCKK